MLLAVVGAAAVSSSRAQEPDRLVPRLRAELEAFRNREELPGVSLAVALHTGPTVELAAGFADVGRGVPLTPDHRMLAASIGKTFVAAVALSLAHEGTLDLDAGIARWLGSESWFPRLGGGADITLRMLLTHTSGIRNHVGHPRFIADWARGRRDDPDWAPSPEQVVGYVLDSPPVFAPGHGYAYTDTGYILAGLVIERASGSTLYREAERRLLRPLGLARTIPSNDRRLPGLAIGYAGPTEIFALPPQTGDTIGTMAWNPGMEWAGGGFASTPGDLARWARALYEGRALPGPYLDELLARPPGTSAADSAWYGLGVEVRSTPLGLTYGHGGSIPGFRGRMTHFADHGFAVAVLTNGEPRGMGAFVELVARLVLDAGPRTRSEARPPRRRRRSRTPRIANGTETSPSARGHGGTTGASPR